MNMDMCNAGVPPKHSTPAHYMALQGQRQGPCPLPQGHPQLPQGHTTMAPALGPCYSPPLQPQWLEGPHSL